MNILSVAFEVAPLAKSGGLADVVASLAIEWKKQGHTPIILIPKFYFIDADKLGFKPTGLTLVVPMGYWNEYATLLKGKLPNTDVDVYLLEHNGYYGRDGIYGAPSEFGDNDRRFIFLARAAFEAAKALKFKPDVIHSHDYHTAFTMPLLKIYHRKDPFFAKTAGVFTIHNLAYQGRFAPQPTMEYTGFGMEQFYPGSWFEYYGGTNYMKTGIMFADKVTTVSPTYSREIRSPYFGEGLHDVLNARGGDLVGILNGIDYAEWNPKTDKKLPINYDANTLDKKKKLKSKFLAEHGITGKDHLPLIGIISRLTEQKGIDLIINVLEDYLWNDRFVFALIGSGEAHYQNYFNYIKHKYPNSSIVYIGYNEALSHYLYGASDFLLIPSRFEPCGLTQMYAMKYGTLPLVRATGGLSDTVREFIPSEKQGNGFVFWNYNAGDFQFALNRSATIYYSSDMDIARNNAMAEDFSSNKCAEKYIECFKWALEKV
ncbi:MAG: glycogen synthase [Ignavibacteria bacterium]|jgi:starch synthase|nr:glycogen synthase [Ignavibacteria bacterium]